MFLQPLHAVYIYIYTCIRTFYYMSRVSHMRQRELEKLGAACMEKADGFDLFGSTCSGVFLDFEQLNASCLIDAGYFVKRMHVGLSSIRNMMFAAGIFFLGSVTEWLDFDSRALCEHFYYDPI